MKNSRARILFTSIASLLGLVVAGSAHAHVYHYNVTVTEVIQWETSGAIIVSFSNSTRCWFPTTDKNMLAQALLLYSTDGLADVVCNDTPENVNGYINTHKLHRFLAKK